MIQDTLSAVAAAVDSLAVVVGSGVSAQVTMWVTLLLSTVTTLAVSFAKRGLAMLDEAPAIVKTLTAVVFGQAATWVSAQTGLVINGDITALETTAAGLVVALGAMGIHAVGKVVQAKL